MKKESFKSIWQTIAFDLREGKHLILMYVTHSEGSSPGRQGFKMVVSPDGRMEGSIGGGIMEHKLVELCKTLFKETSFTPFIKKQIHKADIEEHRSGMICDGEQTIAFMYLNEEIRPTIEAIDQSEKNTDGGIIQIDPGGLSFHPRERMEGLHFWQYKSDEEWMCKEQLGFKNSISIIGGGHVGLALSEVMHRLGFYVINIDDRANLNTMEQNQFAHKKVLVNYEEIGQHIPEDPNHYVALMSFGYRTDQQCMRQLLGRQYRYFGVMGSQTKMDQLFEELRNEGFSSSDLEKVHTPIGIKIASKTPMEIAISVAAQIIAVKNRILPE